MQEGCYEAVLPSERGEHIKSHDVPYGQYNSLDALFRRKRGRPPKNRVIEVWNDYAGGSTGDSPQAIFTSFKLPKPSQSSGQSQQSEDAEVPTQTTLVRLTATSTKKRRYVICVYIVLFHSHYCRVMCTYTCGFNR